MPEFSAVNISVLDTSLTKKTGEQHWDVEDFTNGTAN